MKKSFVQILRHRKQSLITSGLLSACVLSPLAADALNPVAREEATVVDGNARFTILTPEMIRIEYSDKGVFEDRATFAIVNRELDIPRFSTERKDGYLYIHTDKLTLAYRQGTDPRTVPASSDNLSITMRHNGRDVRWYPGKPDPLNLKGTCRTLDGSNGDNKRAEMENGLVSRSGWAVIEDSWKTTRADGSRSFALEPNQEVGYDWLAQRVDPQALDIYFLGYGNDYKKALADFTSVAGKIPLPPAYVFGYWYSKYASYTADDYRQIISDLETNHIPADVMILDMDWHWNGDQAESDGIGGWTGWSWNTKLIPEPRQLLDDIHGHNFKIGLNLHPAYGINRQESPVYFAQMTADLDGRYTNGDDIQWRLDQPDFAKSVFNRIMHDHEEEGVDFWWLDWQQWLTSPNLEGLGETFWCNHVYFNDMVLNRPDRRPLIFHRWGGLGSHRYQIGFSGDALINFPTLAFQPYFTATAANVGYGYWGHDLGGHAFTDENIVNDPELVLRWIQFGVFTPIFRTHATKDSRIERQIWKFPNFPDMLQAVNLRYSLFPYIYTAARETYDSGISICRPLYFEYPETEEAYLYENEYFFGNDILVAPIVEPAADGKSVKEIWFPEGKWWSAATDELIEGPALKTMEFTATQIPYFYRAGAVIPLNPAGVAKVTDRQSSLTLDIVAGTSGRGSLYEDGNDNQDYDSNYLTTEFTHTSDGKTTTLAIAPREIHGAVTTADNLQAATPVNQRAYKVNLLNISSPEMVTLNGLNHSDYTYDSDRHCLTVNIPMTDVAHPLTLTVSAATASSTDAPNAASVSVDYRKPTQRLEVALGSVKENVSLSVCNPAGMECLSRMYSNVDGFSADLSSLPSQIYICKVTADDLVLTNRFLK